MDDFLHRREVGVPQKLGLLTQGEDPCGGHLPEGSQEDLREKREGMGPCQALTDPGAGTACGWRSGNQQPSHDSPNRLEAAALGQVPDNIAIKSSRAEFTCHLVTVIVDKLLNL